MKKKEQQICNYINTPLPQFNSVETFRNGGGNGGSASLGNAGHPYVNYPDPIINTGQYTQMTYPRYINNGTSGYLNTQAMPNVSRNYWDYNDPAYTNYTFVPQPEYINQNPQIIPQQEYINPQIIPQRNIPRQVYMNPNEVKIDTLKEDVKVIIEEEKKNKKNKKNNKSNKKNIKPLDNKTLWNIIIVLTIIVLFFIGKMLYDNKIITFKK
jgi:hypothetical protein